MGIRGSLNYYQEIHVAKQPTDLAPKTVAGATTTPIQDAIDLITDNAVGKPYAVIVHPGTYAEKIICEDYIDLIAAGGREETILDFTATAGDEPTLTGENCMVKGFTIITDSTNFTGRCVDAGTVGFEMEDCVLSIDNHDGNETVLNATASCDIRNCVIDSAGEGAIGALFTTVAQTYNVERTTFDSSGDAIQVTTAITALNLTDCTVSDNFNQDAGTVVVTRSQMEAVALGTAACTFTAELTRFTAAFTTADAFAHTIACHKCTFNGQNFTNNATGTGTLTLRGCDGIATLTNADAGTKTLHDCSADTITTSAGTVVAYGGTIRACGGSTGTSFVWWLDDDNLHVLATMVIQHAITAAGSGDTIHLDAITYTERITLADGVNIEGSCDVGTIISDDSANPVVTAGAVTCCIRQVRIFQDNAGAGAYCLSVTAAATLEFTNCTFDCDATDAIHMVNGSVTLRECDIDDGNIDLSAAACTLLLNHCNMVAGDVITGGAFNHSVTAQHTDFTGNNITNSATGATTILLRFCGDIGTLTDAGLLGTTTIENSVVITGTKTGTSPWAIRLARIATLSNNNGTGAVLVYGGFVGACGGSTGEVVWFHDDLNKLRVISGMKIQHAIDNASANDTIDIGAGTFAEALTIDAAAEAVTLQGEGPGKTIISQADETPLTIDNIDGVVVRDLTVQVTAANGDEAILADSSGAGDKLVTLYNVVIDVDATGLTTDYGIKLTAAAGSFGVVMTEVSLDVNSTNGGATAYGISLEGGGDSSIKESYLDCTCAGTEYSISLSTAAATLGMYGSVITDGLINAAGAFAHALTLTKCDLGNENLTSVATGATTLTMSGCSHVGQVSNAGTGNFTIRDSDVGDVTTTSTGFITVFGGDVGTCAAAAASGDIVWWKDDNLIYVLPAMHIEHALTDGSLAAGDTIELGNGTWAEANLIAINGVDIIGQGRDISIIETGDDTNPIIDVGNAVNITLRNLKISNTGIANGIDIACGANNSSVRLEYCDVRCSGASGEAVTMTTAAAGAPSLEAYNTYFLATTTNIEVSGAVVATVNVFDSGFATGAVATFTGANHIFNAVNCGCAGLAVTVTADNAVVSMAHCNNVGAVSNAGTGAMTFEHCTMANVTNSSTATVTIEHCNCGILAQGAAAGTIDVYNSYLTEAQCGADVGAAINLYLCDIVDIDSDGGVTTVYGGNIRGISGNTGAIVWWKDPNLLYVLNSTVDMKIADALTATGLAAGDIIEVGAGIFAESGLTAIDGVDIIGQGRDISIIKATDNADPIIDVGNSVNITLRNIGIENEGTANGIDIAAGAAASHVRLEYCSVSNTGGSGDAVTLTTTAAGAPSLVAYDTYFNGTDTNIAVSGAVVANIDIYDCQFATGAVITTTGAAHTFDAVNCDCAGLAVTVTANDGVISMTRCNDVGAITNLAGALTLEHCTTGAITNTAGTTNIEHCNTGAFTSSGAATVTITASTLGAMEQGAAAGTITITNSSMGAITTGAGGTIRLNGGCYFTDIAANAGVLTWKIDPNHLKVVAGTANMKIADALTLAGAGDVIEIYPGTYAVANLTMVASVNLVGTDRDQCLIVADSTATPVINSAVTCSLSNLTIGGTNAANPAIAITANILTVRDCYIYGTGVGDAVTMVAGQLDAYNSTVGAGDIDLSTDTCTLNMYFCRLTTDPIDTAGAVAHVLNFEQCDFGGQSVVSAATIGTTLNVDGCTSVGTVSNAGTGAFTINASEVGTVTASNTGTIAVVGGYLGACGGATASVTWQTGALRYEVLVNMRIQDSLTAGAGGEVIIHAGTHEPPNPGAPGVALTVSADTMVRGEGFASIIQGDGGATNITQLMQLNGNNIHIKDMKLILEAGCGTAGAYPNVLYASVVQQLWLENLWVVGDTSVADDGSDARQCGVYFNNVDDSKIMGCRVEDCDRHGIHLVNTSDYNTVSDNTSQGNTQVGILLINSLHNTIKGNTTYGNTTYGIRLFDGADSNTITGNTVQGNGQYGMEINTCDENTITGNTVQGNTSHGIWIGVSANNTVTGNTVVDNDSGGAAGSGIYVLTSDGTVITGNQCSGNGLHGIYIWRSSYCTATGNGCHNQNTGDGINITGDGTTNSDFNTLTGNNCTGNGSNGIEIVGGVNANENVVVANPLKNNTAAGLVDGGNLTQIGHNIV